MKQIIFVKPFETLKSYTLCVETVKDGEEASYAPLVFFVKPESMSDADYHELCQNFQIHIKPDYLKKLVEE